jgi:hypothetical protein
MGAKIKKSHNKKRFTRAVTGVIMGILYAKFEILIKDYLKD